MWIKLKTPGDRTDQECTVRVASISSIVGQENGSTVVVADGRMINISEPYGDVVARVKAAEHGGPASEPAAEEFDGPLHRLWSRAVGQPGYVKRDWMDLHRLLWRRTRTAKKIVDNGVRLELPNGASVAFRSVGGYPPVWVAFAANRDGSGSLGAPLNSEGGYGGTFHRWDTVEEAIDCAGKWVPGPEEHP